MDLLGGASFQRLEGAIHAATLRHRTMANNIANVDTPHFKRSDVAFEELLARSMGQGAVNSLSVKRTDTRHIAIGASGGSVVPEVRTDDSTMINNNRNNVDIDKEMSLLAENQLRYNLFIQQVNHDVKMLRIGIEGK